MFKLSVSHLRTEPSTYPSTSNKVYLGRPCPTWSWRILASISTFVYLAATR